MDHEGLDDEITSSSQSNQTEGRANFRQQILDRDGPFCVITQEPAEDCDATHLIPRSEGDEVAFMIIQWFLDDGQF